MIHEVSFEFLYYRPGDFSPEETYTVYSKSNVVPTEDYVILT